MRRIILACLLVIFSFMLIGNAYAYTAYDLWPVHMGNKWTYVIEGQTNDGHSFDLEVTRRFAGWAYIEGIDSFYGAGWGDRWWLMSPFNGSIWTLDSRYFFFSRVFNLSVGTGNTFTSYIKEDTCQDKTVWKVADENATISTMVGTFKNCLIIENIKPTCADAGLTQMIFAPYVGLIEYSWTTIAGAHTAKIVYALVDGTEYTKIEEISGYTISMTLDKIIYILTENHMPPIPDPVPQKPDTLKVQFKIENKTTETVEFEHSSSQEYDFIIRDDSGNEVYRWSHDKTFTLALTNRKLLPGESIVYTEEFELRDMDGEPLPSGNYTIEGLHTTSNENLRQKAIATFNIELSIVN